MEQELGLERLLQVIGELPGDVRIDVLYAEQRLDMLQAAVGRGDGALGLVHLEVDVLGEMLDRIGELAVGVRRLRAGTRDDERGARLVDEDGVHLVDNGERVTTLHARIGIDDHVVTQVVEAELGIGTIGHVRIVGSLARGGLGAVLDEANAHAKELVDLSHPFAIALGQVIVDGDDVHALAGDGVEIARERRDERLALAGLHLGDLPLVEDHAADELHVEVTQAQRAHRRLAHDGKCLREQFLE